MSSRRASKSMLPHPPFQQCDCQGLELPEAVMVGGPLELAVNEADVRSGGRARFGYTARFIEVMDRQRFGRVPDGPVCQGDTKPEVGIFERGV